MIDVVAEYIRKENTRSLEDENALFSIMADEVTYPHAHQEIMSVCFTTIPGTNPKTSGTRYGENITCRNVQDQMSGTFYDMYEFLCECLEAVLLNPFGYHDMYEEVAWIDSWDQDEGSRATNQSHFVTYHHPSFKRGTQTYIKLTV